MLILSGDQFFQGYICEMVFIFADVASREEMFIFFIFWFHEVFLLSIVLGFYLRTVRCDWRWGNVEVFFFGKVKCQYIAKSKELSQSVPASWVFCTFETLHVRLLEFQSTGLNNMASLVDVIAEKAALFELYCEVSLSNCGDNLILMMDVFFDMFSKDNNIVHIVYSYFPFDSC